jgi:hypothetical protein
LGTVCSAVAIFASAFAPSLPVFILLYSVCGGMLFVERQHGLDWSQALQLALFSCRPTFT